MLVKIIVESGKEEEIQIGNPTDVKHVAHIGWDGPSADASAPSWVRIYFFFLSITCFHFSTKFKGKNVIYLVLMWCVYICL